MNYAAKIPLCRDFSHFQHCVDPHDRGVCTIYLYLSHCAVQWYKIITQHHQLWPNIFSFVGCLWVSVCCVQHHAPASSMWVQGGIPGLGYTVAQFPLHSGDVRSAFSSVHVDHAVFMCLGRRYLLMCPALSALQDICWKLWDDLLQELPWEPPCWVSGD